MKPKSSHKIEGLPHDTDQSQDNSNVENMFPEHLRMVLIGKTGAGKSACGNTILGRKAFESHLSGSSITKTCQLETVGPGKEHNGRRVVVIDTPGVVDTHLSEEEVHIEAAKYVALSTPGPHAFLLVVPLGTYTKHNVSDVNQLTKIFGEEAIRHHTLILFTRGDDLEGTVEDFLLKTAPPELQALIDRCGGRYHVFNNKNARDSMQVKELISKVENMANQRGFYTSELYKETEAVIMEEYNKLLGNQEQPVGEDQGDSSHRERQAQPGSSRSHKSGSNWHSWLKAALSPEVLRKIKIIVAAIAAGAAVGALAGLAVPVAAACVASLVGTSVCFAANLLAGKAAAAAAGAAVGAVVTAATSATALGVGAATGALVGGAIGANVATEADSPSVAVKDTVKQVVQVGAAAVGVAAVAGGVIGAVTAVPAASGVATGAANGTALSGATAIMQSAVDAPVTSCAASMLTEIGTTAPTLKGAAAVVQSTANFAPLASDATIMMTGMGVAAAVAAVVVSNDCELVLKLQTEKSTSGEGPGANTTDKKTIDFTLKKKNTGSDQ